MESFVIIVALLSSVIIIGLIIAYSVSDTFLDHDEKFSSKSVMLLLYKES